MRNWWQISGLEDFELEDTYGNRVTFTRSSALRADGPNVWMWIHPHDGGEPTALHMNVEQLRKLRDAVDLAAQRAHTYTLRDGDV